MLVNCPPVIRRLLIGAAAICATSLPAGEVQSHGLLFEQWLRDTFFGGGKPAHYTQLWDIPAEANRNHGRIPVNPKTARYGSAIDFGDAGRQFSIAEHGERFLLIVGFWEQASAVEKRWVNVQAVTVRPAIWQNLWHPITKADLDKLDALIKDRTLSLEQARERARGIKSQPPFAQAIMQVNPKIDRSQRRLQCSLRFDDFFAHLAPNVSRGRTDAPALFGVRVPRSFSSGPRRLAPHDR